MTPFELALVELAFAVIVGGFLLWFMGGMHR